VAREKHEGEAADEAPQRNWHAYLPPVPKDFPLGVTLALTVEEAEFLRERITFTHSGSLLEWLANHPQGDAGGSSFLWEHPALGELTPDLGEKVVHARNFSQVMHGTALLYNLMLAEKAQNADLERRYENALRLWSQGLQSSAPAFGTWDRGRFWEITDDTGARLSSSTKTFINHWLDLSIGSGRTASLKKGSAARDLISERERALKKKLARLHNSDALRKWTGAAGTAPMSFRWGVASQIIADIHAGLR